MVAVIVVTVLVVGFVAVGARVKRSPQLTDPPAAPVEPLLPYCRALVMHRYGEADECCRPLPCIVHDLSDAACDRLLQELRRPDAATIAQEESDRGDYEIARGEAPNGAIT